MEALAQPVFASVLLALRIGPAFAFAPPFTLTRVPPLFRVLMALGLAACMVGGDPVHSRLPDLGVATLLTAAVRELMLGAIVVLAFHAAFGALYLVGRTIDIQAGFGLAVLIDPTTRGQTPLVGALFAYAAGAIFFAMDGHADLVRLLGATLEAIPLGTHAFPESLDGLTRFLGVVTTTAFGIGGGVILCLFLTDLALTALSRTVPQMNVLILGFQVKTILLLVLLPATFGFSAALMARLMRYTLQALPGLM